MDLPPGPALYRKRIRAWALYDWANSAFATTILAAVLPVYYSRVAGAYLESADAATGRWELTLSLSLLVVAVLSPILGTLADVARGKKRFLAVAAGIGVTGTALLVLVERGDWLLASALFVVGRVGFAVANVFYDSLLPHVAREEDQDRVSTLGYALGYLGGGLLLAIDVVLILAVPGTWGPRLSFLSVAVWWALFAIPLLRQVPEPPAAGAPLDGGTLLGASFRRLRETFAHLRRYRHLLRYLVAFLLYNDGIGTIIGVAAIYATGLGFSTMETVLAVLLVQFVGIPFSLLFGRIPRREGRKAAVEVAFVLFNVVALPLGGILGARLLPADWTGRAPPPFESTGGFVGQGRYDVGDPALRPEGENALRLSFHGERVEIRYAAGPDAAAFDATIDGRGVQHVDAHYPVRRQENVVLEARGAGDHTLVLESLRTPGAGRAAITAVLVLPPVRRSRLGILLLLLVALQALGLLVARLVGPLLCGRIAAALDTKRTILLCLGVYVVIASWAGFLDSVIEFWFLAWMVAVVQGGSQGLSRSLYAHMSPKSMSGEFFGFFTVMSKFSAILGPLVFWVTLTLFGSSRPAIFSIVIFFVVGGLLLLGVDTGEGHRVAREADRAASS